MHGKTSAADFSIVGCHYRFGFICINRANTSEVNPFSSQSYTISIWMHRGGRGKANRIRQGNYENWKTPFYHGEHVREEHKFHSSYRTPAETTIRREQYLLRAHQSMQQEKSQTQDDNRTTKDIKGCGVAGAVSSEHDDNVENDNLATIIFQDECGRLCVVPHMNKKMETTMSTVSTWRMSNVQLETHSIQVATMR